MEKVNNGLGNGKAIMRQMVRGNLEIIMLELLREKPSYGYRIIVDIRNKHGVYFGPSTIYPLLGRLEKTGYAVSSWTNMDARPRKVYQLTSKGQQYFNDAGTVFTECAREIAGQMERAKLQVHPS
jgi:PadR family transcriptional regulator PadR